MINENFVFIGTLLSLLGGLAYFKDTLTGRVKPNRVTWFLWTLAPAVAFIAQISQGVGIHQSLITFMAGFNSLIFLFASFVNK